MLNLEERIDLLDKLGKYVLQFDEAMQGVIELSQLKNRWFTHDNTRQSLTSIATQFLNKKHLTTWSNSYTITNEVLPKQVGIILAGNIPAVGFHDILCCFISGHTAILKLSEKDSIILPYLVDKLKSFDSRAGAYFKFVNKLKDFEAVIATGSNNSATYFEQYFGKYPHIIRKNRNGVAVLTGKETDEELTALGHDIFDYFGLGCRNVSKIYVPQAYSFDRFLEVTHGFNKIINHSKYKNNFDYNYAILILNKEKFLSNGCLLLREDKQIASRISNLNYEYYSDLETLEKQLIADEELLQCICSSHSFNNLDTIPLGTSQTPALASYADGVDTMQFLVSL